jgi:hypothetical protein
MAEKKQPKLVYFPLQGHYASTTSLFVRSPLGDMEERKKNEGEKK